MSRKKRTSKYKKKLGLSPGSIIYTGYKESQQLFIETFDYYKDTLEEKVHDNVEDVFHLKTSNSISWININGLNHVKEIEKIGNHFNLHALTLEDIVNTRHRPKIDDYNDYIFIVLKMLYQNKNEEIVNEQVSFILGDNYVISFQEADGDVFDALRERIRNPKGRIRTMGSDYLQYALMDAIADHYFVVIESISHKISRPKRNSVDLN